MARCSAEGCQRWYPDLLARNGAGTTIDAHWFCSEGCVERTTRRRLLAARPMASGLPAMPPARLGVLLGFTLVPAVLMAAGLIFLRRYDDSSVTPGPGGRSGPDPAAVTVGSR